MTRTRRRRPSPRRFQPWALAVLIVVCLVAVEPASSRPAGVEAIQTQLEALEGRVEFLESEIAIMERSADRFYRWMLCISLVPVSVFGDQDHTFGFAYDERDGTGLDHRSALAVDEGPNAEYQFLQFNPRNDCWSDTTKPGTPENPGTADPAMAPAPTSAEATMAGLERRLTEVSRRAEKLNDMSEKFDEWESCLSSVGVTEYGDPDGQYGYLYEDSDGAPSYAAGLTVDVSEWDDPDYFFLAFIGQDRPFTDRECGHEPGESVD